MAAGRVFNEIGSLLAENKTSIQNVVVILLVFGGEAVFEVVVFKCPCHPVHRIFYSWMFIVGPAFTLFVIGVVVNNKTWKIITGCCRAPNGCIEFCKPRNYCDGGCCGLIGVSVRALVGAVAWIFIAFMSSVYYACAMTTAECEDGDDSPKLNDTDMAVSQTIGWCTLVGSSFFLLLSLCHWRMCDRYTHEHREYRDLYKDIERQAFIKMSKKEAEKQVNETLEMFFEQEVLRWKDQDSGKKVHNAWSKVSLVGSDYLADFGYTTLHEWAISQGMKNCDNEQGSEGQLNKSESGIISDEIGTESVTQSTEL
ncbi:calcium homeostasis modulator protein 5-like [Ptychodera flava]|uniref:calcium homeostasis modulator protein 5-like n=1 Tax=Ptychodera flava TaxID=63121 RepID=UPI003969E8FA